MKLKIKNSPKIDLDTEKSIASIYMQKADKRFGELLGNRLKERATTIHMEKTLSEHSRTNQKGATAKRMSMLLKWQFAFFSALAVIVVIGGTTAMAIPSVREKIITAFKPHAVVTVGSNPEGAQVWIGQVMYGETPASFRIPTGEYTISIRKDGFDTASEIVELTSGKVNSLTAVLIESEDELKYTRSETWNLYQDPEHIYRAYFPFDWNYEWEPFTATDFYSGNATFTAGETLYAKIYYSDADTDEYKEKLNCGAECRSTPVSVLYGAEKLTGHKIKGESKQTGRITTYMVLNLSGTDIGYSGSLVFESNSILSSKFIEKLQLTKPTNGEVELDDYSNETYGFGFGYPKKLGWKLYEIADGTYVQASADGAVFSITVGGVNTDTDNSVKSEEILINIGDKVVTASRRYYAASDYYIVQSNITKDNLIYGIEYMYTDNKWTNELQQVLKSVWLDPPVTDTQETHFSDYYIAENVLAVTDSIYPDNGLRCSDGVMITGKLYTSDESGNKVSSPEGSAAISIKVKKNGKETTLPIKVYTDDENFVIQSALLRNQLFSPIENTCGLEELTISLIAGNKEKTIWASEYTNLSKSNVITTGIEGIVTSFGTGVADYGVEIYKSNLLVDTIQTGAGGHFMVSIPAGSYQLRAGGGSADVTVTQGIISYVSISIQSIEVDSSEYEASAPKSVNGTVQGFVHTETSFAPNTRVELLRNNRFHKATQTDSLGRFKFENLTPGSAYTIRIPGKTIIFTRWDITVDGLHILPDGGTLRVDSLIK